ncbi:unnamed protein product [Candidula unifasciata]|uniref:TNFR-Cys domain-containing protein n=1 Tax=Candidula unifasciata TaxID=100452 RepID=A0A8S3Z7C6_9EUPU|nr:unnamed protein product [Candidula unifasciata]
MVPACSLLLLLVWSACSLNLTHGRVVTDEDPDTDEEWPVLCPPDTFYSLQQDQCMTCSQCPMNKIILSPCQGLHDTRCGPFYDYHGDSPAELSATKGKLQKDTRGSSNQSGKQSDSSKPETDDSAFDRNSDLLPTSLDSAVFSDSQWKSLTIALIVLVSVVFVLVVTFVTYFLRKSFMNKTKIVCEYSSPPEIV